MLEFLDNFHKILIVLGAIIFTALFIVRVTINEIRQLKRKRAE